MAIKNRCDHCGEVILEQDDCYELSVFDRHAVGRVVCSRWCLWRKAGSFGLLVYWFSSIQIKAEQIRKSIKIDV